MADREAKIQELKAQRDAKIQELEAMIIERETRLQQLEQVAPVINNLTRMGEAFGDMATRLGDMIKNIEENPSKIEEWKDEDNIVVEAPHPEYQDGVPEDVTITYLSYESSSWMAAGEPLIVKRENLGDMLSLKRCAEYLHKRFPQKTFTHTDVQRCYHIFLLSIKKETHVEFMDDNRTDVCFEDYYLEPGLFSCARRDDLKYMFKAKKLIFACYNINDQDNDDYKCSVNWDIDKKKRDTQYPSFTLKELLQHDWAYEIFCKFWENVRDHEQIRALLYPLPKDVIDYTFGKLTSVTTSEYKKKIKV